MLLEEESYKFSSRDMFLLLLPSTYCCYYYYGSRVAFFDVNLQVSKNRKSQSDIQKCKWASQFLHEISFAAFKFPDYFKCSNLYPSSYQITPLLLMISVLSFFYHFHPFLLIACHLQFVAEDTMAQSGNLGPDEALEFLLCTCIFNSDEFLRWIKLIFIYEVGWWHQKVNTTWTRSI